MKADRHNMAKLLYPLFPIALSMLATGCVANAQNSDLGLLLGVMTSPNQVSAGSGVRVSTSDGGAGQLNYAYQVKGWKAGDLYVEIPFIVAGRDHNVVAGKNATSSSTGIGGVLPGVRFKLPVGGRLSLYAAGGAGFGFYGDEVVSAGSGSSTVTDRFNLTAALDFGGGLDLRLTRLLSLRGEVRDLVLSSKSLSNSGGHNNAVLGFGFAFHF
jgi:hypothetical protein